MDLQYIEKQLLVKTENLENILHLVALECLLGERGRAPPPPIVICLKISRPHLGTLGRQPPSRAHPVHVSISLALA